MATRTTKRTSRAGGRPPRPDLPRAAPGMDTTDARARRYPWVVVDSHDAVVARYVDARVAGDALGEHPEGVQVVYRPTPGPVSVHAP